MLKGSAERYVDAKPIDFALLVIYEGGSSMDADAVADMVIRHCCTHSHFELGNVFGEAYKNNEKVVIITIRQKTDGTNYFIFENDMGDKIEFEPDVPGQGITGEMIDEFFEDQLIL